MLFVNFFDFGFNYFINKFIFLNVEMFSFFIMFVKLVFYVWYELGLLLNGLNCDIRRFFFRRNCVKFLIILGDEIGRVFGVVV